MDGWGAKPLGGGGGEGAGGLYERNDTVSSDELETCDTWVFGVALLDELAVSYF